MKTINNYERNGKLPELEVVLDILISETSKLSSLVVDIETQINWISPKIEPKGHVEFFVSKDNFCDAAKYCLYKQTELMDRLKQVEQALSEISPYRLKTNN